MTLNNPLQPKLVRFVIVGVTAAVLLFTLTYLLNTLGLPQIIAAPLAYSASFVYAYTLQHGWTFRGSAPHRRALPRYLIAQLGCAGLAGIVGQSAAHFGAPRAFASIAATVAASATSYFVSMLWVFYPGPTGAATKPDAA
jgi:putative flippase GtrA